MSVAPPSGQNRVMIYGPKNDGTYIVEFRTADGEALAISVPASETRVLKHFQKRMAYGMFVPDVREEPLLPLRCFQRTLLPPICHREDVFCCSRSRCVLATARRREVAAELAVRRYSKKHVARRRRRHASRDAAIIPL
jgi:hypothetical protein